MHRWDMLLTGPIGPSYRLVADDIRARIRSGEYPVGQPIPSTVRLQEQYGVSDTVIRQAVKGLQDAGVLIGHPGKAVYVKATPADATGERQDIGTLRDHVTALQSEVHELAERVSMDDDLRARVGRIEAALIDLYGKLGFDYPQDHHRDGAKTAAGRGRTGR